MINEKIFQQIFTEIEGFLSNNWDKLVVYLEYGEASYTFAFYEKANGKFTKCYDLENISLDALYAAFSRIDKAVAPERERMNPRWSNMTLVVDATGKMRAYFDYSDLSTGAYRYSKEWKKKYLV